MSGSVVGLMLHGAGYDISIRMLSVDRYQHHKELARGRQVHFAHRCVFALEDLLVVNDLHVRRPEACLGLDLLLYLK